MFKENDVVMYGIQGVCCVQGTVEKNINGETVQYYALTPVYAPSSTIFVPTDNSTLTERMKPVLSAEEIREIIREMPFQSSIWIPDDNQRKERFKNILMQGDRRELSALIKTLYLHRKSQQAKGKKLHLADERYLKEAEKMLYSEFAVILQKKPEEMPEYIESQLQEAAG